MANNKKYKPGTILKAAADQRLYVTPKYNYRNKDALGGSWQSVAPGTVVMVLNSPMVPGEKNFNKEYYYELLVGDKHAQHFSDTIENESLWKKVGERK